MTEQHTDYELVGKMIQVLTKEKDLYNDYRDNLIKEIGYDRFKDVQSTAMKIIFGSRR